MVLEEQVVESVIEQADVTEVDLSYDAAIAPAPPVVEQAEDDAGSAAHPG